MLGFANAQMFEGCQPAGDEWHCGSVRIMTFDAAAERARSTNRGINHLLTPQLSREDSRRQLVEAAWRNPPHE